MMHYQRPRKFSTLTTSLSVWLLVLGCTLPLPGKAATNPPPDKTEQAKAKDATNPAEAKGKTEQAKAKPKADPKKAAAAKKPVYPPTLKGAKQAFKDQNYKEALRILAKLEPDYAGNVEYDYLLGRSALETKNFDIAVAALNRALTVDPNFAGARFELARAYYSKGVALLARGPFEQARLEFKLVAGMHPPPELKAIIDQYQANIDKYLKVRETEYNLFAEMTTGYDTNINSTPTDDYFSYYDPYSTTSYTYDLRDEKQKQKSPFGQAQVGGGIAWPIFSNNFEIFGNLMGGSRSYSYNHDQDYSWHQVQIGIRHYGEHDKKTLRFRFRGTDINGFNNTERYHEQSDGMLEWAIKGDKESAFTFWIMGGDSNYQYYNTYPFSVNYNRQGAEATHLSDDKRKSMLQLMFVNGRDDPQRCDGNSTYCPDAYTRDLHGFRVAWSMNILAASRFYSSAYVEDSHYDRDFFYQRRRDKWIELFMAVNTPFADHWYFRPEIHYVRNNSTIDLFDYDRWVISMTLGWGV